MRRTISGLNYLTFYCLHTASFDTVFFCLTYADFHIFRETPSHSVSYHPHLHRGGAFLCPALVPLRRASIHWRFLIKTPAPRCLSSPKPLYFHLFSHCLNSPYFAGKSAFLSKPSILATLNCKLIVKFLSKPPFFSPAFSFKCAPNMCVFIQNFNSYKLGVYWLHKIGKSRYEWIQFL